MPGVGILQQDMQPAFKPGARPERTRRIDVRCFIKEQGHESVDVFRQVIEVHVIEFLSRLHTEPELLLFVVQRGGKPVDEAGDILFVGGIDLFPIHHHACGPGISQNAQDVFNKVILPVGRTVRQILDRFRLPGVPDQIRQERHQDNSLGRSQFG